MAQLDLITRNLMLDSLKEYAKRKINYDFIREMDRLNECPVEILKEMYDPKVLGVHLISIPEEYGGIGGGTLDLYRICELLARIDLGIATSVFATYLGIDPINVGGTKEQKAYWLGRIARERLMVAYGATEPDAGSDLVNLKTKAEHVVKDGKIVGYKITGLKQWISNGGIADLYTILAMAPGGPSWFVVERNMEGFSPAHHEDKHGIRLSNTAGLSLDQVYVPAENLIGGVEGQGLLQAQAVFGYTRLMVAAFGLGCGWSALETAIRYSQQRIQAGGPLSEKQGYMNKLIVPHAVNLEAARSYIEYVANRLDSGEHGLQTEGAIAKYWATESGNKASEDSIQALGGYGYTRDFPVEKIKRDVKITCIYEGTNEIMEMTIYRGRWQEHLKTRGNYYLEMAKELEESSKNNNDSGMYEAALGLKALSVILEECRINKLTRHQYVTFVLGKLISMAEHAYIFSKTASKEKFSDSVKFDSNSYKAMSRVFAKTAALKIAQEGSALVLGANDKSTNLADKINLAEIEKRQYGIINDMDIISKSLVQVFKSR
ncbi:MAG: acyl-CoA dehydrogenase family protein [Elusimicrobiales bacterium]|mgnify:CR=1 FL=1|jgi:alkylation response protein AidB-like acyl-CoA dehydrogenase|nr:acyl-CoA dehydrogenase family protein [Elusimicrobiales bacterium]HOL62224.1 acyl-CoA dehydrogenase family protein [Elusimicrobiales bacterium]HPO94871.1 acyl-CoA dehydrogenase family protein [Elusimicrobiales bacterium]